MSYYDVISQLIQMMKICFHLQMSSSRLLDSISNWHSTSHSDICKNILLLEIYHSLLTIPANHTNMVGTVPIITDFTQCPVAGVPVLFCSWSRVMSSSYLSCIASLAYPPCSGNIASIILHRFFVPYLYKPLFAILASVLATPLLVLASSVRYFACKLCRIYIGIWETPSTWWL